MDFETNTIKWHSPDLYVRSVALSNDDVVLAVDFLGATEAELEWWWSWCTKQKFILHNAQFDNGVIYHKTGVLLTPHADTFILFKMLGGKVHSHFEVGHGLKDAQEHVLGWPIRGDGELHQYMTETGLTWDRVKEFNWDILGYYNAYDADSTWQLYKIFKQMFEDQEEWGQTCIPWHQEDCLNECMMQIEAIYHGLDVDEEKSIEYTEYCQEELKRRTKDFYDFPDFADHLADYETRAIAAIADTMPNQYNKDGKTVSKNWIKKQAKLEAAKEVRHFNLNSPQQLAVLLYDAAGYFSDQGRTTKKDVLKTMGKGGALILSIREMNTELKFLAQLKYNTKEGKLTPTVMYPATITGRVSSKEEVK